MRKILKHLSPIALVLAVLLLAGMAHITPVKAQIPRATVYMYDDLSSTYTAQTPKMTDTDGDGFPDTYEDTTRTAGTYLNWINIYIDRLDLVGDPLDPKSGLYGYEFMLFYEQTKIYVYSTTADFRIGLLFDGVAWIDTNDDGIPDAPEGADNVLDASYEVNVWKKEVINAYNATHGRAWMSITLPLGSPGEWSWNSDLAATIGQLTAPRGMLAQIRFRVRAGVTTVKSQLDIMGGIDPPLPNEAKLSDGYAKPIPNVAKDAVFRNYEEVPEFPLGIGIILAVAPAIPVVYLLRTRKKEAHKQ